MDEVKTGFTACLRLTMGLTADREFVNAMVEVVSVAVRDAEAMAAWDGPTKRAFATKSMLSMMEEFSWIPEGAWYRGALEGMLGIVIDIAFGAAQSRGSLLAKHAAPADSRGKQCRILTAAIAESCNLLSAESVQLCTT